jgi:hypothetical protein
MKDVLYTLPKLSNLLYINTIADYLNNKPTALPIINIRRNVTNFFNINDETTTSIIRKEVQVLLFKSSNKKKNIKQTTTYQIIDIQILDKDKNT